METTLKLRALCSLSVGPERLTLVRGGGGFYLVFKKIPHSSNLVSRKMLICKLNLISFFETLSRFLLPRPLLSF